jgi:hypothetical protein
MALIIIPTSITKSNYVQNTTLDGVEYVLRFRWNQRESKWYLAIELPDETVLVAGTRNGPWTKRLRGTSYSLLFRGR